MNLILSSSSSSSSPSYLLLEDGETGDVLLPLVYMKAVFEANYSRKLASLKHRLVPAPPPVMGKLRAPVEATK